MGSPCSEILDQGFSVDYSSTRSLTGRIRSLDREGWRERDELHSVGLGRGRNLRVRDVVPELVPTHVGGEGHVGSTSHFSGCPEFEVHGVAVGVDEEVTFPLIPDHLDTRVGVSVDVEVA